MDYQQLHALLPKPPIKWSAADVSTWLAFIGLEALAPEFISNSIDGSCILTLEQQDLRSELQVKSNIIVKKLMTWIKTGLAEFQQYLITHQAELESFKPLSQFQDRGGYSVSNEKHAETLEKKESSEIQKLNLNNFQLFLEQLNTTQKNNFYVPREGAKIGRSNGNDIILTEVDVSRNHAEIISNGNTFWIRDRGSVSGTFIQIIQPLEIKAGTLIEIGSHILEIGDATANKVSLTVTSQNNSTIYMDKKFNEYSAINIGRKSSNDIVIEDDSHLSNNHATIYYLEGKCYFRDLNTTNGSWLRLSAASQISAPFQLKDQCIIKIGMNITYVCKLSFREDTERATENSCAVCYLNPKDCVTLPCNHNSICIKCCKTLKQCPICRVKIENFLRIYHK